MAMVNANATKRNATHVQHGPVRLALVADVLASGGRRQVLDGQDVGGLWHGLLMRGLRMCFLLSPSRLCVCAQVARQHAAGGSSRQQAAGSSPHLPNGNQHTHAHAHFLFERGAEQPEPPPPPASTEKQLARWIKKKEKTRANSFFRHSSFRPPPTASLSSFFKLQQRCSRPPSPSPPWACPLAALTARWTSCWVSGAGAGRSGRGREKNGPEEKRKKRGPAWRKRSSFPAHTTLTHTHTPVTGMLAPSEIMGLGAGAASSLIGTLEVNTHFVVTLRCQPTSRACARATSGGLPHTRKHALTYPPPTHTPSPKCPASPLWSATCCRTRPWWLG
jgi:hypothetical protein